MSEFRTRNWIARSVVLLVTLLFAVPFVSAQVTTGNLQGIVKDPNGAVVAGAAIKVTNASTGIVRETTSNDEGFYRVTNLLPGDNYTVEVTAAGFAVAKREQVPVRLGIENDASIQLSITTEANVQVTAEAPLIQTTQSQLSQAYTPRQLTQLPFNGSIDNLALLTPGVVTPGDTDFTNGVGISANGNRGRSNNFQIDGQDNNDNSVAGPSLSITNAEAIGEFQVITNTFSAEFGRNSGAQVNTITKSGTNEFHGTIFEFHQNAILNARDNIEKKDQAGFAFLNSTGFPAFGSLATRLEHPNTYRENRFGGSIGGPLKTNKAFFFVTYQGDFFRGEGIASNLLSAASATNLAGAQDLARLFPGPATANLICTVAGCGPSAVLGQGLLLLAPPVVDLNGDSIPDEFQFSPGNPYGQPTTAGFLQPMTVVNDPTVPIIFRRVIFGGEGVKIVPTNSTQHQIIGRVDYTLTSKDTIVGRYIYDNSKFPLASGTSFTGGSLVDVPSSNNNLGITYTRTISSNKVNEARFNFSALTVSFGDTNAAVNPPSISFASTNQIPFGNLAQGFGLGSTFPQSRTVDVYQYQDTLSWTAGNHSIRFGADIRQQKVENYFLPNVNGTYQFRATASTCTAAPAGLNCTLPVGQFFNYSGAGGLGGSARTSGTAFENYILGRPTNISFALGNPLITTNQDDFFFFFQDDWRVLPTLTLNLGVRYEISSQPLNPIIDQVNARETDPGTAIFNQAFPLSTRTATQVPLDKNNFAPRVGFAWSPNIKFLGDRFSNGKTVIRGNFGVAYDPSFFNIVLNTVTAAPFAAVGTIQQNNAFNHGFSVLFPFLPTTTAQLNTTPGTDNGDPRLFNQTLVSPDFHNPYALSYGFGIQQEVFKNSVFEARYVGTHLIGQFQSINANPNIRFLNIAGQTLFGDPGRFTGGVIPGTCTVAGCVVPTVANGFQNRPSPGGVLPAYTSNGRINPLLGPTRERINGASSTYNGMQLRFDTRFFDSLTLDANYSLSKTLDNASEIFATFAGGQSVAFSQNPFNTGPGERGLSAFHQKHNFTTNFLWDLPWFKEQHGVMGHILGGFQLNAIIRAGSGRSYTPVNITGDYDAAFDSAFSGGAGLLRTFNGNPNAPAGTIAFGWTAACTVLFGDTPCLTSGPGNFIIYNTLQPGSDGMVVADAAAAIAGARLIFNDFGLFARGNVADITTLEAFNYFQTPYGDTGRNTINGLPFYLVNMSVFKTTNITENTKLELRIEGFNLMNRRNFGVPDLFTEDASNGFAVSSFQNPGFNNGGNRSLRIGLRFIF